MKYKITTDHAASSYGSPVLVDEKGQAHSLQEIILKKLGERFWNKERLAKEVGCNRDTIFRFFAGQDMGYQKVLKIFEALEIDLASEFEQETKIVSVGGIAYDFEYQSFVEKAEMDELIELIQNSYPDVHLPVQPGDWVNIIDSSEAEVIRAITYDDMVNYSLKSDDN